MTALTDDSKIEELHKHNSLASYIGPGYWIRYHRKAARVKSESDVKQVFEEFEDDINNFPCDVCKSHAQAYLKENKFDKYLKITDAKGNLVGPSYYLNVMHNYVNRRLNKPIIDFITCQKLYSQSCKSGCAVTNTPNEMTERNTASERNKATKVNETNGMNEMSRINATSNNTPMYANVFPPISNRIYATRI